MPTTTKKTNCEASRTPVWGGPVKEGITFSLLSRYLCCRERFRILVMEGLKPAESFNHKIFFGSAWHVCEEALAQCKSIDGSLWQDRLQKYAFDLCRRYPLSQEQISHWYDVVRTTFPVYVKYWEKHPDVLDRTQLLSEQTFDIPYRLSSGRLVRLRGKWDSVDIVGKGEDAGIFLQENKTKGEINEQQIKRQLTFDLQMIIYLVALKEYHPEVIGLKYPIRGVRYNVIRRPLSGGRGTIVRHKPSKSNPVGESKDAYYRRLGGIIEGEPETYFMRWTVGVLPSHLVGFRRECLDPVLENLLDDYEWWSAIQKVYGSVWDYQRRHDGFPHHQSRHFRLPFGIWNPLLEGGASELDEYLHSGSTAGLTRVTNLFPELKGDS